MNKSLSSTSLTAAPQSPSSSSSSQSNNTSSFQQNIQRWVAIDNELKNLNEKSKRLRDEKEQLTTGITSYASSNHLWDSNIRISDGNLKFTMKKDYSGLTFSYLDKCLRELINNSEQVDKIMEYIKNKREVKMAPEIKRFMKDDGGV